MASKFFAMASVVIVGTRALLHHKVDVPQWQSWEDFEIPADAGAIPGANVGQSDGVLPPDVNFDQTPISDGQSEGVMPPDVNFDQTPISDGQSEGVMPPDVNFDQTPISDGQSEGVMPPDVNFDQTPISDGQSEGVMPPDVNFDGTPIKHGESEGVMPPEVNFDHTPISDGKSEGVLLPTATPGQVSLASEVDEGIVSLVPNDNLICYQAPKSDMDGMLRRLKESPLSGLFGGVELSAASCKTNGFQSRIGQTCYGDTYAKSYDLGPHMNNELALKSKAETEGSQAPPKIQCIECDGHC